ncbi:TetR/AcrR family transcriptional regulator [Subtercola sp. YIM 133946]|uniref:TetR/AcrR family transcriptional regulator n=1 Tax=Subtercola sp. YIM 133946 TaxID=3118909 RepID=UPI002F92B324
MLRQLCVARPRTFDETQALRAALLAFWEFGYEATTLAVLMEATGLNKTGLYRTFGSKEQLFGRAVEHVVTSALRIWGD